jgi:hypothetical protein
LPAGSQSHGNHQSPKRSKPLTGEPDAGDLQVRFGGRGGAIQCPVPTSILLNAFQAGKALRAFRWCAVASLPNATCLHPTPAFAMRWGQTNYYWTNYYCISY